MSGDLHDAAAAARLRTHALPGVRRTDDLGGELPALPRVPARLPAAAGRAQSTEERGTAADHRRVQAEEREHEL